MKSLFPFQRDAVKYISERRATFLCASMGCGKSAISITATLQWLTTHPDWRRILVICPASLKQNWMNEWNMWQDAFPVKIERTVGIAAGNSWPDTEVVIINYDILSKFDKELYGEPWDVIIVDESHALKNGKAARTKAVLKLKARRKLCLTGTPILNKPYELWTQLQWLAPETWRNWRYFVERYCDAKRGFGNSLDVSGASNLRELNERLRSSVMFRITKEEALKDLPPCLRQLLVLPPPEDARPLIDEEKRIWRLRLETVKELRAAKRKALIAKNEEAYREAASKLKSTFSAAMSAMSKIRHDLGVAKIPLATQHIQDALDQGADKLIVFAHHKKVLAALADALQPHGALMIVGETPVVERQEIVDKFQTDSKHRVIVCSILAAGVGLNLQAASHVVMVESDWRPGICSQAYARCHRIGQKNSVLVQHLCFDNSLDARMVKRCIDKQSIIDQAIDGKRESKALPAQGARDMRAIGSLMTDAEINAARAAIKHLCAIDLDAQRHHNGTGFSEVHRSIAHKLDSMLMLTPSQAATARDIATKYQHQLPPSLRQSLNPI